MSDLTQKIGAVLFFWFLLSPVFLLAGNGEEGAAFLEIPTGARSAALGGSYTALATNADAPVWNPAAMTYVLEPELSAQHLIYLQGTHYEYASFVWPASAPHYVGAAIQYFGSGAIPKTDAVGASIGDFSSSYAAYSLSYARRLIPSLSWGGHRKNDSCSD